MYTYPSIVTPAPLIYNNTHIYCKEKGGRTNSFHLLIYCIVAFQQLGCWRSLPLLQNCDLSFRVHRLMGKVIPWDATHFVLQLRLHLHFTYDWHCIRKWISTRGKWVPSLSLPSWMCKPADYRDACLGLWFFWLHASEDSQVYFYRKVDGI